MNDLHNRCLDTFPEWLRTLASDATELGALLGSDLSESSRRYVAGGLNYLFKSLDLIPDGIDDIGYLDDAFVLKLALAESRHEWFAWCEYVDYVAAHPDEAGIDRETWMQRRRARLDQQLRRRNDAGYPADGRRDQSYVEMRRYTERPAALARFGVR